MDSNESRVTHRASSKSSYCLEKRPIDDPRLHAVHVLTEYDADADHRGEVAALRGVRDGREAEGVRFAHTKNLLGRRSAGGRLGPLAPGSPPVKGPALRAPLRGP